MSRDSINYQLTGLAMQLRYLRDALMCTFMDIPVNYFYELRGNLPAYVDERMPFLERMVSMIDVEFFKNAKIHIFNTIDINCAVKFCELDLVIWQLVMLSSRFEEEHSAVKRIADMVSELLQLVYFLKVEMLHKEFFKFNTVESIQTRLLLEKVAKERTGEQPADKMYAGWSQLEGAVKAYDERTNAFAEGVQLLNDGTFEPKSVLSPEDVKRLYLFLGGHRTATGPKNDVGVIDISKVSLSQFTDALWHGCFTEIYDGDTIRKKKLRFFVNHFSKAYIKDWKGYRKRVARSVNLTTIQLDRFTKDDEFAEGLKEVLPLVNYNNT